MKKVLLYYNFSFSFGGGELLPLSFISGLQHTCNLTVALDKADGLWKSAALYGIGIDPSAIHVEQVMPKGYSIKQHNALLSLHRSRMLKRLARNADICISLSNITDFGKPAHHFINMLAFGDDAFTAFVHNKAGRASDGVFARTKRFFSNAILRPILGMRSKRSMICDRRERIYPNSQYVERLMTKFYGPFNSAVFYPPTLFAPQSPESVERDPLRIVYIGRIVPEKRITDLIGIVERARAATGLELTFHLAGRLDQTPTYGEKLSAMARERDWLKFVGAVYGDEKERFLMSGSFALHAERVEAFGISVAEYLVAGLIPVVPDEGGTPEVVGSSALAYHADEDAAQILARLATDRAFRDGQRHLCAERARTFTRAAYMERQRELLSHIVGDGV